MQFQNLRVFCVLLFTVFAAQASNISKGEHLLPEKGLSEIGDIGPLFNVELHELMVYTFPNFEFWSYILGEDITIVSFNPQTDFESDLKPALETDVEVKLAIFHAGAKPRKFSKKIPMHIYKLYRACMINALRDVRVDESVLGIYGLDSAKFHLAGRVNDSTLSGWTDTAYASPRMMGLFSAISFLVDYVKEPDTEIATAHFEKSLEGLATYIHPFSENQTGEEQP